MKTIKNVTCRMCDGTAFQTVINFGSNPLVNSLIDKEDLNSSEPEFPLVVKRCTTCGLVQIKDIVDSDEIYKKVDYLYFSGDMPGLKDYFTEYVIDIKNRFLQPGDLVVEIGSNDGTMLQQFQDQYRVLGVDPASNVVVRALKYAIPTLSEQFTEKNANSILREFGKAKVIYGNNCIAHLNDLKDLMRGVSGLLADDGVFIVECNYWGGMVKNKNYSLIYHDHFSYFTAENWDNFAKQFGLTVFDAIVTPAQGGSLRIFMSKNSQIISERFMKLISEEQLSGLNGAQTCQQYKKEVIAEAKKLGDLVRGLKAEGKRIAGYGAAAKGFSILKLANITSELEYFVDDSPAKQGKYTPVNHIPVISRQEAESRLPDYFFITAPNYNNVIIEKEADFKASGGKFILADSSIV